MRPRKGGRHGFGGGTAIEHLDAAPGGQAGAPDEADLELDGVSLWSAAAGLAVVGAAGLLAVLPAVAALGFLGPSAAWVGSVAGLMGVALAAVKTFAIAWGARNGLSRSHGASVTVAYAD